MDKIALKKHISSFFYKENDDIDDVIGRPQVEEVPVADSDFDRICKIVFKPDLISGNPSSEILYLLSGADDGFKRFIKENLMMPQQIASFAEDPEVALDLVHKNLDSAEQYKDLVQQYVTKMIMEE